MILHKHYGIKKEQILYSPIGTDLSVFNFSREEREKLRAEENISLPGTVLLYTGKLNARKNPHLILEALKLVEERVEHPLHIYFLGAAEKEYFDRSFGVTFANKNIHTKVVPAVPVSTLYRWYSMADFAVFPNENTLSALDAQACKLPVIMESDATNLERLARGGLTFEKGNMRDLSEKILSLIRETELRQKLGADGESYVREKYDYRKIVKAMESDLGL
jgi:glycosyltransferase involved in cell wall biosynthesis